ncbi:flagellar brake protein [Bermanella marisrubri]|uniref:PilZ domain-containing protein n=1 Tax=Bermanella marisrubri TaxID=207949 RepID=Q1N2N3_9GAMM|nr:flagellar brake protein [Bermanella marisrubri]EAT12374.1 hypothetical protein RED65_16091 [Oceanobacter sp. RED65] [Bermanella marisrubri]QIZ85457.1 flagellar brake protein [Bermanella marisrubri]
MEEQQADFWDLKLLPGQILYLEFEGYTKTREKSVLVGYRRNGSLIVTTPYENGTPIKVRNDEPINVRLFVGKRNSACAFQTHVLFATNVPFQHIHLKMPDYVITGEIRKSVRAEVEIISRLSFEGNGEVKNTTAKILDLSFNGARIAGKRFEFEAGTAIDLEFELQVAGIEVTVNVPGVVRSIQEIDNGMSAGVQFEDVDDLHKIAIQAYVLSQIN